MKNKENKIKLRDLVIGNYFSYYNEECIGYILGLKLSRFTSSLSNDIYISVEGGGYTKTSHDDLKPIELTEEWLIKLGFDKESENEFTKDQEFCVYRTVLGFEFANHDWPKQLKYVHQLQNIYNDLTEKELI